MNALERKLSNLVYAHKDAYGNMPKYLSATIRWNDDKVFVHNTIFCLEEFDGQEDDDQIFFYTKYEGVVGILANIDFTMSDFDTTEEFFNEVNKYDTDDPNSEDWSYLHRGEDFVIVEVESVFDNLI